MCGRRRNAGCGAWLEKRTHFSLQKSFGHFLLIHFGISWAAPGGGSGLSGPACRLSTFRNLNLLTNEEVECDQETRRHGAELLLKSWAGITGQADFAATKSLLSRGVNTEVQKSSLPAHV